MGFHRGLPLGSVCMTPWCHTIYWVIADRFQPPTWKCPSENYFIKHPVNPRKNKDPLSISFSYFYLSWYCRKYLPSLFLQHLPHKAHHTFLCFLTYHIRHLVFLFSIFPLKHIIYFPFFLWFSIRSFPHSFPHFFQVYNYTLKVYIILSLRYCGRHYRIRDKRGTSWGTWYA